MSSYSNRVIADAPVGYWRLAETESYAQAVLRDGAVGYWRLGEASGTTAIDSSANALNGTYNGGFTLGQPAPLADGNTAVRFNGTSGYAQIANAAALQIVGDLTIECWLNPSTLAPRFTPVTKNPSAEFELTIEVSGNINFYNNSSAEFVTSPANAVPINTWTHVVVTRIAATKTVNEYVNGVLVKTGTYTVAVTNSTNPVRIGAAATLGQFVSGLVDDVAIYPTALSVAQIANHYALRTSGLTAISAVSAADSSGNGKTGTYVGGVTLGQASAIAGDGNAAALLDGANGVVKVLGTATIGGLAACTLEGWINFNGVAQSAAQHIFLNVGSAGHYLQTQSLTPDVSLRISTVQTHVGGAAISNPGWHHIVATWSSGNPIRLYQDGVLVNSSGNLSGTLDAATGVSIGAFDPTAPSSFFGGSVDELAIYTTALSAAQIAAHYALRTATPYSDKVIGDGAIAYWRLDEPSGTTATSLVNGFVGTLAGGVTVNQDGALRDGDKAMAFDGATGVITVPNAAALQIVGDLTVECWVKRASSATRQTLLSKGAANEFELTIENDAAGTINFYNNNENVFSSDAPPSSVGRWMHVVVTRVLATKTITIYRNGVVVKTGTYTGPVTSSTNPVKVGSTQSSTQWANGVIDEVVIYTTALSAAQIAARYALSGAFLADAANSYRYQLGSAVA